MPPFLCLGPCIFYIKEKIMGPCAIQIESASQESLYELRHHIIFYYRANLITCRSLAR